VQTPQSSDYVRVDTGVRQGDEVSVYYDPMIAKLIVWDEDRDRALNRLTRALSEYRISGMTTNIDFLYNLANCRAFRAAELDTGFIEKHHAELFHDTARDILNDLPLAALYVLLSRHQNVERSIAPANGFGSKDPTSPWNLNNAWRSVEGNIHTLKLVFHETEYSLQIEQKQFGATTRYLINCEGSTITAQGTLDGNVLRADFDGYQFNATVAVHDDSFSLYTADTALTFRLATPDFGDADHHDSGGGLLAPMNGTMVALLVEEGASVQKGDALLVMEAMKMEHTIRAPADGHVVSFYYKAGELVDGGSQLLEFSESE
jgi:3-methylcrotonyl-CoA carboxylase alpha subunit